MILNQKKKKKKTEKKDILAEVLRNDDEAASVLEAVVRDCRSPIKVALNTCHTCQETFVRF